MKIGIQAGILQSQVVKELLSPWNLSFSELADADVTLFYGCKPSESKPTVVIPSSHLSFLAWAKKNGMRVAKKHAILSSISVSPQTTLSFTSDQYTFQSSSYTFPKYNDPIACKFQDSGVVLTSDIVQEFTAHIQKTLRPKQSALHHILTGLPIPYGLAPKQLRDYVMKANSVPVSASLYDKLPIDALRYALVRSIELASDKKLEKKDCFTDKHICMLTHDVETATGMKKAVALKKIEEKYDVASAWYVPSRRYPIDKESINQLSIQGEVGAHDTKHDGKLAHLSKEKIIERVSDAKIGLSKILKKTVEGFRAPILQHNSKILEGLSQAGYLYDTSIPTWEPKHPYTMKPHGIGTIYPLTIGNLTEIPLTLPQDHQLMHVLGLTPQKVVEFWQSMKKEIEDLNGICMFLIHPDYDIGRNLDLYEELIATMSSDRNLSFSLPSIFCSSHS
jgi:hypothetical protein